jgi:hypothetical protein
VDGAHLWSRRFGSTSHDVGYGIAADASGNVLVSGYIQGTVDFGGGPLTSAGGYDIFVVKLSGANGAHLWSQRFGDTDHDLGYDVAADRSGNALLAGNFSGTVDFGGGPLTSAGSRDIFVAKFSGADGSHLWSQRFGATDYDVPYAVTADGSGNVIVTGSFYGTVDFGGGPLTSAGSYDIFVAKFSGVDGAHLWSRQFGGPNQDTGNGVAVDGSGNVLVTGEFMGPVNFGGGPLTSAGSFDIFVAKFSGVDGAHLWSQRFGDTGDDGGHPIAVDASGNVLVTGYFCGTVDFGGGPLTSAACGDIFVAKFSGIEGTHLWSERFGGPSHDAGGGVTADGSGNVLVTGHFQGTVDFGGEVLTSAGAYDIFVLKLANGITNVSIDIKPGSYPNSINLGANGVVPVAILTTPEFDASAVDGLSLALSGASVKLRGKSQEVGALEDVDNDGDLDLVVQFYINELKLTVGATEAVLTGKTKSGAEIMGKDSVRIVPQ